MIVGGGGGVVGRGFAVFTLTIHPYVRLSIMFWSLAGVSHKHCLLTLLVGLLF